MSFFYNNNRTWYSPSYQRPQSEIRHPTTTDPPVPRPQFAPVGPRPRFRHSSYRPQFRHTGPRPQFRHTGPRPQFRHTGPRPQFFGHIYSLPPITPPVPPRVHSVPVVGPDLHYIWDGHQWIPSAGFGRIEVFDESEWAFDGNSSGHVNHTGHPRMDFPPAPSQGYMWSDSFSPPGTVARTISVYPPDPYGIHEVKSTNMNPMNQSVEEGPANNEYATIDGEPGNSDPATPINSPKDDESPLLSMSFDGPVPYASPNCMEDMET